MLSRFRAHFRQQFVGYIAIFIALGGTSAYAANTVFSSDIVDGEVKTPDLANDAVSNSKLAGNTVGSAKVADQSLTGVDVANNSLTGADIDESTLQTQGLDLVSATSGYNSESPKTITAHCPAGKQLIRGGGRVNGGASGAFPNRLTDVVITDMSPTGTYMYVTAIEEQSTSSSWSVTAQATCANSP